MLNSYLPQASLLNPDVSEDSTEGSRRLNELIPDATAFEDLSEEYKIKVSFAPLKMIVYNFLSNMMILAYEGAKQELLKTQKTIF